MTEHFNIHSLIGEATAYDKKEMLERKNPRSWLKSVSAFANGGGGVLIFGITDDDQIVGIADAKQDSEDISEAVKTHMDPIPTYQAYEHLVKCRALEFRSTVDEFHVVLWNMNYDENVVINGGKFLINEEQGMNEVLMSDEKFLITDKKFLINEKEFLKERKKFLKAQRKIYALISADAHVTTAKMAEEIGVSDRQIRKYLKRLTELKLIAREGSRKTGTWKITDEEYTGFFDRI